MRWGWVYEGGSSKVDRIEGGWWAGWVRESYFWECSYLRSFLFSFSNVCSLLVNVYCYYWSYCCEDYWLFSPKNYNELGFDLLLL